MKSTYSLVCAISATFLISAERIEADDWTLTKVITKPGVTDHRLAIPPNGDFLDFIKQSTIWLDKSMLIKTLWEARSSISVICGPPGWGKTINLSMLKFYHQLNLNEDGSASDRKKAENYQYFVSGKILNNETGYEIAEHPLISDWNGNTRHLGRYPTIYLNGSGLSVNEGIDSIRRMIFDSFQLHNGLYKLLKDNLDRELPLADANIKLFKRYFLLESIETLDLGELATGISHLSNLLSETYHQKVIIFFDDFDAFVRKSYFGGENNFNSSSEKSQAFNRLFDTLMLCTFKNNRHFERAVITGVLSVQEILGFSGFNKADYFHVFGEDDFYPFYGIFKPEFSKIAKIMNWNYSEAQNITKYYDGYFSLSHLDIPIYPAYSIALHLSGKKMNFENSRNFIPQMLNLPDFRNSIVRLLQEFGKIQCSISTSDRIFRCMQIEHCKTLRQIQLQLKSYDDHDSHLVFSLLFSTGLVSINPTNTRQISGSGVYLRIPNLEIWNDLCDQLLESMDLDKRQFSFAESSISNYVNSQDDSKTLPSMTESVSKSLFNHDSKSISKLFIEQILNDEKAIEILLRLMFQNALQPESTRLGYRNDPAMIKKWDVMYNPSINLTFLVKDTTVLSIEVKYCPSVDLSSIQAVFNESLSYSGFYRAFDVTQHPYYKFLAVCVSEGGKMGAMSLTLSSSNLSKIMIEAEKKLDHDFSAINLNEEKLKKQMLNYDIWRTSIIEQISQMYSSFIVHSFHESGSGNSKISNPKGKGGQKKVYKKALGVLSKTLKKPKNSVL